ncbi:NADH-ubiquinone oxidoreductase 14 kDa subunit [Terfezia boudieri ATCC MYA-4762]|uniref:NADH-ubiquinone oxidoreductase 14 kDa subunit n=1 Tax=Terfezia boudieri ATCC MYA-4762 TaxID=1051890 RepID=A0A3N4M3I5_9PEZI|nr:NADH-ubiquinone oxidoreductase 14 kDa subunit [Terfezia boudieri ATCC MYA-4762]
MPGVLGWAMFGAAVRWWQLGLEMRPFFSRSSIHGYPIFAAIGGGFGYWLQGVSERQQAVLEERRTALLEKRRRAGLVPELGVGKEPVPWVAAERVTA